MQAPPVAFPLEICLHQATGPDQVPLVTQNPHHLHQRHLRKHIPALDDSCFKQVAPCIIDPVTDPALHALGGHYNEGAAFDHPAQRWNEGCTDMTKAGTGEHESFIAAIGFQEVRRHTWIKLEKPAALFELLMDTRSPASTSYRMILQSNFTGRIGNKPEGVCPDAPERV